MHIIQLGSASDLGFKGTAKTLLKQHTACLMLFARFDLLVGESLKHDGVQMLYKVLEACAHVVSCQFS